jgi:hypothetical protein
MVEAVTIVRSLHILFAVLWAGGAFHFQKISKVSMEGQGALLEFLGNSKHGPYTGITALGTFAFGTATWAMVGGDAYSTAGNVVLGFGALGATVGMLVGFFGHLPVSIRIKGALAQGDDESLERLARRETLLARFSISGIGLGLLAMITFRWF